MARRDFDLAPWEDFEGLIAPKRLAKSTEEEGEGGCLFVVHGAAAFCSVTKSKTASAGWEKAVSEVMLSLPIVVLLKICWVDNVLFGENVGSRGGGMAWMLLVRIL